MPETIVVSEWDADEFHRKVAEFEAQGYEAVRETYKITPEMDPSTGLITHLHSIQMRKELSRR